MRPLCFAITLGIGSLAVLCLTSRQGEAHGRDLYGPVYCPPCLSGNYGSSSYYSPHGYCAPYRYYSAPSTCQPCEAPAYSPRPSTRTVTVGVYDFYFEPRVLRVTPGTKVRWVNYGKHHHTVTSNDARWGSGDLAPGATYSGTFRHPGTYYYYCRYHTKENMRGTIIVGSGGGGANSSRSSGY
jgi:plastocyanin